MTAREAVSGLTGTTSPTFTVAAPQATTELNFHDGSPAEQLEATLRKQVLNAIDAVQYGLKTYESLRNLSEVIGGEYGDRVIFELVQNGADAMVSGRRGRIHLALNEGTLYCANEGDPIGAKGVRSVLHCLTVSLNASTLFGKTVMGESPNRRYMFLGFYLLYRC